MQTVTAPLHTTCKSCTSLSLTLVLCYSHKFAFNLDVERTLRQLCKCNPYRHRCITPVEVALPTLISVIFLQILLGYRLTLGYLFLFFNIHFFFKRCLKRGDRPIGLI